MKKQKFHTGWRVEKGVKDPFDSMNSVKCMGKEVILPHDAMIIENRSCESKNGNQTGYYPCESYTYTKIFSTPEAWKEQQLLIEFEGVMKKAMVYINGELAARNSNGYSQFYVDPRPYLKYGVENEIKVIAINEDKSSRWYPGSGIYRDVNLYTGGCICIMPEGVRITTTDIESGYAVICIDTELKGIFTGRKEVELQVQIIDSTGENAVETSNTITVAGEKMSKSHMRLIVPEPHLWSPEEPNLYLCRMTIRCEDEVMDMAESIFGIRKLQLDARQGLRLNGKSIKLRGACIHHDNGVIGACTLAGAEEFRCRKLKEAGFNSIRSSHHPMSKAMLRACDRLGMLVIDELTDMWDVPKNSHDFSFEFGKCWKEEVRRMVSKDYNHPSVIFYSVGNEIPECGTAGGRIRNREIANLLRKEDPSRFVTCGINGFLALAGIPREEHEKMAKEFTASSVEVPTDIINKKEAEPTQSEGSEKLNNVMGDIPFELRDMLNTTPLMTKQLKELGDEMDVIGLNYMPMRHILEHDLNKDHIVMGSESYPTEIPLLWKLVRENPFVIGDFTWTGYDYLGEAGIGSYHYEAMPQGQGMYPDRLAYCGDINLNGYRRPVSYLREMIYGLRKEPYISVERVDRYGYGCVRNHWKVGDEIASWTFPGYEGTPARIKVFSPSEEVELFLNGKSMGRKPAGKEHEYMAEYETIYNPGMLTAVGYDSGEETARFSLGTAGESKKIDIIANTDRLCADGSDALIIEVGLVDENGIENMWEEKEIKISIDGPAYLAGFGNADPSGEESYQSNISRTFDGRILAVIRSTTEPGVITVHLEAEGVESVVYQCCSERP